jgi:hypothetical protein
MAGGRKQALARTRRHANLHPPEAFGFFSRKASGKVGF